MGSNNENDLTKSLYNKQLANSILDNNISNNKDNNNNNSCIDRQSKNFNHLFQFFENNNNGNNSINNNNNNNNNNNEQIKRDKQKCNSIYISPSSSNLNRDKSNKDGISNKPQKEDMETNLSNKNLFNNNINNNNIEQNKKGKEKITDIEPINNNLLTKENKEKRYSTFISHNSLIFNSSNSNEGETSKESQKVDLKSDVSNNISNIIDNNYSNNDGNNSSSSNSNNIGERTAHHERCNTEPLRTNIFLNENKEKRNSELISSNSTFLSNNNNYILNQSPLNEIDFSVIEEIKEKIKDYKGKINILIAGKTNVGKSTLINSIFNQNLTQEGSFVTQEIIEITKEDFPISIFDTMGLKMEENEYIINEFEYFIEEKRTIKNINEQLHLAWLCIQQGSVSFEQEVELNKLFIKYNIPVIIVITKSVFKIEYINEHINIIKKKFPNAKQYISVLAKPYQLSKDEISKPLNLDKLVKETIKILPDGIENAFAASQKVSEELKNNNNDNEINFSILKKTINSVNYYKGKVNIVITGKTGVGKSSLINSIFHQNLAEEGIGRPVTQEITEITKKGFPISIFDTKGLEIEDYENIIRDLENFIIDRKNRKNPKEQLHVVWLCISQESSRIEQAEIDLITMLNKYDIPVIIVITKSVRDEDDEEIEKFYKEIIKNGPTAKGLISVIAKQYKIAGTIVKPKNLDLLVKTTSDILPDGIQNAFAASQKVLIDLKNNASNKILKKYIDKINRMKGTLIPFNDSKIIISQEIKMITEITDSFGLTLNEMYIKNIVKTIFGNDNKLNITNIFNNLSMFIPGVNFVAGNISKSRITKIINIVGHIYINALYSEFTRKNGEYPFENEIIKAIEKEKEKQKENPNRYIKNE